MQSNTLWRILTPVVLTSLLAACGGENNQAASSVEASKDLTQSSSTNETPKQNTNQQTPKLGKKIAARNFATDTRKKDRDGIDGIDPILSKAPKSCKIKGRLGTGPMCSDFKKPGFYSAKHGDTWIDAQVFIPEHREGESLPVILHSHGWGRKKLDKLPKLSECKPENMPYNCPVNQGSPILKLFDQVNDVVADLYRQGYIVVSFTQRGFGKSEGDITIMNPYMETQDAIAVIDWIAKQGKAGNLPIKVDSNNDFKLGLVGGSYGGGFQFPLAALDSRVDTLVPVATWNSLRDTLFPNGAIKGGWGNLLCVMASVNRKHPLLSEACAGMFFPFIRKISALDPTGEIVKFITMSGFKYFEELEKNNQPFQEGLAPFKMRPVDTLLIQGNRDILFPLKEALNNYKYLKQTGADVRLLTNESGHINPMADQVMGTNQCRNINIFRAMRIWLDVKLRNADPALLSEIPQSCISLDNKRAIISDTVPNLEQNSSQNAQANQWRPFKVAAGGLKGAENCSEVYEVPADSNMLLAGQSWLREISVKGELGQNNGVAYLGLCIKRDGRILLVDDAITGFVHGYYPKDQFVAVGAKLKEGDKIGVYAAQANGNMNFLAASSINGALGVIGQLIQPNPPKKSLDLLKFEDFHKRNLKGMFINAFSVQGEVSLPLIEQK